MDRVRFLRLDRCYQEHWDELTDASESVLQSGQVVGGPVIDDFEDRLSSLVGRRFGIAVQSGTDALRVAALAAGVGRDWTAVGPAYSFTATAGAIRSVADSVRTIDVDDYYHMNLSQLSESLSDEGPKVVVPVGLFGDGLDDVEIDRIVGDQAIVLEDAAQSLGSRHRSALGGCFGKVSTLSFAPTKVIPCFGNMGMVVTDDEVLADRARRLRRHGKFRADEPASEAGMNSMPNCVQAAQLLVLASHHDDRHARRQSIARAFLQALAGSRGILSPPQRPGTEHAWHKFVVRHPRRDALKVWLDDQGIDSQVHYPLTLDAESNLVASGAPAQHARALASTSLSLPFYPEMLDCEINRVCAALVAFEPESVL